MKKRVLCLTALMVGSLGMAACGGGKQGQEEAQAKDVNGIEEAQKQESPEAREQEADGGAGKRTGGGKRHRPGWRWRGRRREPVCADAGNGRGI